MCIKPLVAQWAYHACFGMLDAWSAQLFAVSLIQYRNLGYTSLFSFGLRSTWELTGLSSQYCVGQEVILWCYMWVCGEMNRYWLGNPLPRQLWSGSFELYPVWKKPIVQKMLRCVRTLMEHIPKNIDLCTVCWWSTVSVLLYDNHYHITKLLHEHYFLPCCSSRTTSIAVNGFCDRETCFACFNDSTDIKVCSRTCA